MVPSAKNLAARSAWPTWSIFCVLGLSATLCGLFLPQSLRGRREPAAAVPTSELAQEKKDTLEYNPPALPDMPSPGSMFLRLALGTIFVLVLCAGTLWAGKRWIRPLTTPIGENRRLRVLESLPLAGRCSVFLLQAGGTKVLVGVDQAGIKALLPLPQLFDGALAELEDNFTTEESEPEA
jgi:flagellar biogenesis protein FliO